ncbi:MAG: NAD(P)H-dependent oxidoreductase subunit E [Clostridiales bacterium]|nr:NAD(P)H-dependent oxidoreductase subunit E [Clostridiales bacterium]
MNENDKQLAELDSYIDSFDTKKGKLIVSLHKAQDIYGYLSVDIQKHIAKRLGIPASKVYGVVTFYSFFNTTPKGKYSIDVCMGTACFVRGSADVLEEFKSQLKIDVGGTTEDGLFSLDSIRCVGACGLAPVVSVNGKVHGRVTRADVSKILDDYKSKEATA